MAEFLAVMQAISTVADQRVRSLVDAAAVDGADLDMADANGFDECRRRVRMALACVMTLPPSDPAGAATVLRLLAEEHLFEDGADLVELVTMICSLQFRGWHLAWTDQQTWVPEALLSWIPPTMFEQYHVAHETRWRIHPDSPIPIAARLIRHAPPILAPGLGMSGDLRQPLSAATRSALRLRMGEWAASWRRDGAGIGEVLEIARFDLPGCVAWLTTYDDHPLMGWRRAAEALGMSDDPGFTWEVVRRLSDDAHRPQVPPEDLWISASFEGQGAI